MQITNVHIQNFFAVQEAKFNLADRGLVLIQGKNDDPSADSNGAGKSSLVDAICWGLYGSTARGVSTDAVVNKKAKKNCHVALAVMDGAIRYNICRGRKPSYLTVSSEDGITPAQELTLGTDKETQLVIDRIMGCTKEVFTAAVYAGQEAMPDLPGMTDKQLKLLIEEAAGVEKLSEAYANCRTAFVTAAANNVAAKTDVERSELMIKTMVERLSDTRVNQLDFDSKKAVSVVMLKDRARQSLRQAKEAKAEADKIDIAALDAECATLKVKNDGLQAERDKMRDLQRQAKTASEALSRGLGTVDLLKKAYDQTVLDLTSIKNRIGTPCRECGKPYAEHDMETATIHAEKAVETAKGKLHVAVSSAVALKKVSEQATADVTAYGAVMTDPLEVNSRLGAIAIERQKRANSLKEVEGHVKASNQAMEDVKSKSAEVNPYESQANDCVRTEALARKNLREETAKLEASEKHLNIVRDAVEVFGPSGVRAHILDTVTPFLNDRTTEYLGALSDGTIQAVWTTLTKTAKGELREKFSIDVESIKGAETFAGLSGGEKRKVRLACAMALQDLVATRATKPIDLFIADEVDHALDESGLERLMAVLDKKAKERGTVLVISHNSLSDWIDTVITVTKTDGVSTIGGAVGSVT